MLANFSDLVRELPESVRSMIDARLPSSAKRTGGCWWPRACRAPSSRRRWWPRRWRWMPPTSRSSWNELERVHAFVRLVGEYEFPDRTLTLRYRSVHVLYQNALYASLRPTRRASLMRRWCRRWWAITGGRAWPWPASWRCSGRRHGISRGPPTVSWRRRKNAARLFANQEAVVLAPGAGAARALPDTAERARKELTLQLTLGPVLKDTKGWTAPEVESTYTRADELCGQVGETPDLFPALWGLWLFHMSRGGDPDGSEPRGAAPQPGSTRRTTRRCSCRLITRWDRPMWPEIGPLHRRTWSRASPFMTPSSTAHTPSSTAAMTRACAAWALRPGACGCWAIPIRPCGGAGRPSRWPRSCPTPSAWLMRGSSVGIFHQFRRDVPETQEQAEAANALGRAGASLLPGGGIGAAGLGAGRTRSRRRGACSDPPGAGRFGHEPALLALYFHALLAETYGKAGKVEEGLAALAEALRAVDDTGIGFYEPELHRLKGELLLARAPENPADAEACFRQAIAIARRQEAKSLELRAVMSLSRLLQQQGRKEEARPMLAEIYGWFTEGFDTADLQEAKALLAGGLVRGRRRRLRRS